MSYKDKNKEREYQKIYKQTHPEIIDRIQKKYTETHRKEINARSNLYSHNHRKQKKENELKRRYGLSITEYNNLLLSQDNRCAICGQFLDLTNPRDICIDHNHQTGVIRGILCHKCNLAIGLLRDNPEYTNNATIYLKRSE